MNELKIILSENSPRGAHESGYGIKNLIFEVKNISGTNHYREDFNKDALPDTLKNYLKKIYNLTSENNTINLGNDFLKAVKSLEKLPGRVITVKSDSQWRRDNSPLEFTRIESNAKVTSRMDLHIDKNNYGSGNDYSDQEPANPDISFSMLEQLKENVKRNPNDPDANFKLGIAYLSQKSYDDAVDSFREAININPGKEEYYYNLGCAYYEKGSFGLAIAEFREAININPEYYLAFFKIGKANYEMGKLHDSIPYFHQTIVIKPIFLEAYLMVGQVYNQLEYYAEAIFIFEEVLSFDPMNSEAMTNLNIAHQIKIKVEATELNNIGIAYAEKGNMEKAVDKFKKALALNPNDAEIQYNLGLAYQKQELFEEAIIQFKNTIKIDPGIEDVHLSLGDIYKSQKRFDMAISQYEKFLEITSQLDRKQEVLNNIKLLQTQIR